MHTDLPMHRKGRDALAAYLSYEIHSAAIYLYCEIPSGAGTTEVHGNQAHRKINPNQSGNQNRFQRDLSEILCAGPEFHS
jgi:hypothetical protein